LLIPCERGREICRHAHVTGLTVRFDVDVDLVAGGNPGGLAVLRTERHHEAAAHRRNGGPVDVVADRDRDRGTFAGAEPRDDLVGHREPGRCLAAQRYRRPEPHGGEYAAAA
jgi:hypothetical protein